MSPLKDIYWIASPFGIKERVDAKRKLGKYLGPQPPIPAKEHHSFRNPHHWTLEIDGICYELSPNTEKRLRVARFVTDTRGLLNDACEPHSCIAQHWHQYRTELDITPERRKIGQTRKSHKEILAEVDYICKDSSRQCYGLLTQNCQHFIANLHSRILVPTDDSEVSDAERASWVAISQPVSHPLADGYKNTVTGGTGIGTIAAYIIAVADVAEATQQGGIVAGEVAAESIEEAAAQGTLHSVGAVDAAAKFGSAAVGAKSAGPTLDRGAEAASAAPPTNSGAEPTTAATKGTIDGVGGEATATAAGSGAKVSGYDHAAVHSDTASEAANIGGSLIKAGPTAAAEDPVAGAAVAGAGVSLVLLAALGKRDRKWLQKRGGRKLPLLDRNGELSGLDILEWEEEFLNLEMQDFEPEVTDRELDQALAEDLKFGRVTTEPASMPDEVVARRDGLPAGEVAERAQSLG